jgi:hypothetical protein
MILMKRRGWACSHPPLDIIVTRSEKLTPIAVFCSLIGSYGRSHPRSAFQKVLLAVIFRCENAPDCQTGFEPGISQNISAVFSRISAILGVGNPSGEDSLRRRSGAGARAGSLPVLWGVLDPQNRLPFISLYSSPSKRTFASQKGLLG